MSDEVNTTPEMHELSLPQSRSLPVTVSNLIQFTKTKTDRGLVHGVLVVTRGN
jgi:hypothetical protein